MSLFNTGCYVIVLHGVEATQRILTQLLLDLGNLLLMVFASTSREVCSLVDCSGWLRGRDLPLRLRLVERLLLLRWLVAMICHNFRLRSLLLESVSAFQGRLRPELFLIRGVSCA